MLFNVPDAGSIEKSESPRHAVFVRVTHWITAVCFFALLISGGEIVISHPRFYWGETGNDLTPTLFKIPIPASRNLVPTGYGYVLPDQNGWSRYLHFQAAWAVVLTGILYVVWGLWTGHFRSNLFPAPSDRTWRAFLGVMAKHVRLKRPDEDEALSYNVVQRTAYLIVIFVLFPLVIWTGLALSPAFNSAFPVAVTVLGGRQSARTLHFFVSVSLLLFLIIHVAMVILAGFVNRMRAMTTGTIITGTMDTPTLTTGTTTTAIDIAPPAAQTEEPA
jgi:thiosulfate reductase cytochrome b subunit